MPIAKCKIMHSFIADDKGWKMEGDVVELPELEARRHEVAGYLDVLSVDGTPEVWASCCACIDTGHGH